MMTEEEYHRKRIILSLVNHPDWIPVRKEIRAQIMEEMMLEKSAERRNELFYEAQALDRVVGRLTGIANEIRLEEKNRNAA